MVKHKSFLRILSAINHIKIFPDDFNSFMQIVSFIVQKNFQYIYE